MRTWNVYHWLTSELLGSVQANDELEARCKASLLGYSPRLYWMAETW